MQLFRKWADREYSKKQRSIALMFGAVLFLLIFPFLFIHFADRLDRFFGFSRLFFGAINVILGLVLILSGYLLAIWTIILQFRLASGTPFPMMPTKKLLIIGPFRCCRNPMTLGTILAYFGLAIFLGSLSIILVVIILAIMLVLYLRLIEEKELEDRFGQAYLAYKKETPFIIPKIFR